MHVAAALVSRLRLPGFALGFFGPEGLDQSFTTGTSCLDGGRPITETTNFHMASVTKPFVATAVMQLVERGLVDIARPVSEYVPYFEPAVSDRGPITVGHLLTHTSGLPDVVDYGWDHPEYDEKALERYVRGLSGQRTLFRPGDRYAYSNNGYEVLGALIAETSATTFEQYVHDHILGPLGMSRTTLNYRELDSEKVATGHVLDAAGEMTAHPVYPYHRAHAPSSTLCSNLIDMGRWGAAYLTADSRILARDTLGSMRAPYMETDRPGLWIGLGWFVARHRGKTLVLHSGGDVGFRSYLALLPDDGVGLVFMANGYPWYMDPDPIAITYINTLLDSLH